MGGCSLGSGLRDAGSARRGWGQQGRGFRLRKAEARERRGASLPAEHVLLSSPADPAAGGGGAAGPIVPVRGSRVDATRSSRRTDRRRRLLLPGCSLRPERQAAQPQEAELDPEPPPSPHPAAVAVVTGGGGGGRGAGRGVPVPHRRQRVRLRSSWGKGFSRGNSVFSPPQPALSPQPSAGRGDTKSEVHVASPPPLSPKRGGKEKKKKREKNKKSCVGCNFLPPSEKQNLTESR